MSMLHLKSIVTSMSCSGLPGRNAAVVVPVIGFLWDHSSPVEVEVHIRNTNLLSTGTLLNTLFKEIHV